MRYLLAICIFTLSCTCWAQDGGALLESRVSFKFNNIPLERALKRLESDVSGLVFVYSTSIIDVDHRISAEANDVKLSSALDIIFEDTKITYHESNRKILLKPRKSKSQQRIPDKVEEKSESLQEEANGSVAYTENKDIRRRFRPIAKPTEKETPKGDPEVEPQAEQVKIQPKEEILIEDVLIPNTSQKPEPNRIEVLNSPDLQIVNRYPSIELREKQIPVDSLNMGGSYKRILARERRRSARLNEEKKFRIYGASYTGYTRLGNRGGVQMGGSLVWLKNKRFGFGLGGHAIQTSQFRDNDLNNNYRIAGGYGGFQLEYTYDPTSKIHFSFPVLVGGGGLSYVLQSENRSLNDREVEDATAFFVFEPGVVAEVNVIKYLRAGLGLSYRFTSSAGLRYNTGGESIVESNALAGLNFGLWVKFGLF